MSTIDKAEAARILGMKQSEVYRVIDTKTGPVIVTTDGTECLVLEDRIMFLNKAVKDVLRFPERNADVPVEPEPQAEIVVDEHAVAARAAAADEKRQQDEAVAVESDKATPEAAAAGPVKKAARGR